MSKWNVMANKVLAKESLTPGEALSILMSPDEELLDVIAAAYRIRYRYFQRYVRLQYLMNAKSGLCPEDCQYCSQSRVATADIPKYPHKTSGEILEGAHRAHALGATTYCIVASGRGPTDREVDNLVDTIGQVKNQYNMRICACLGLLKPDQAQKLKEAGVERYNHNVNSSEDFMPHFVTTHGYTDRVKTINLVKATGLSPCSGVIFGMGETLKDRIDAAFALKELDVDSIPVNFLVPIKGTPLEHTDLMSPQDCLRALAMMRLVNPSKEIRIAGGREVQLRSLQPLGLYVANSIFIADYLTTPGQSPDADHAMIQDMGFEIEPIGLRPEDLACDASSRDD
ncbi:MAG: biotin synthase BioB [Sulfobacillus benefaciens]|uniref:Biotin synthase n=1 Tax=Sulfobacillus benefaciens TaxID=453960 RepID=A0A2T2WRI6_9FIRM|nr:MAG: biotin synthase BioB [Sulfobacillus benefaciens]